MSQIIINSKNEILFESEDSALVRIEEERLRVNNLVPELYWRANLINEDSTYTVSFLYEFSNSQSNSAQGIETYKQREGNFLLKRQ